eukprot:7249593-Prymnesium_polylepis.1
MRACEMRACVFAPLNPFTLARLVFMFMFMCTARGSPLCVLTPRLPIRASSASRHAAPRELNRTRLPPRAPCSERGRDLRRRDPAVAH